MSARPIGDDGIAHVDVVEDQQWRRLEAQVDDLILDVDDRLARRQADASAQEEVAAEDVRLAHLPADLGDQSAVLLDDVMDHVACGDARDASVQPVADALVLGRQAHVLEAARREQPAVERAQPVGFLEVRRMHGPRARSPADLVARGPDISEIEAAIGQDDRREPAAGSGVDDADAVLAAIGQPCGPRGDQL